MHHFFNKLVQSKVKEDKEMPLKEDQVLKPFFASGKITEVFEISQEVLGSGQFGIVTTCTRKKTGDKFACKTILKKGIKNSHKIKGVQSEVFLTSYLPPHPNIVRHVAAFEDDRLVHIVMERCVMGDLFSLINSTGFLPECVAAPIFKDLATAFQFCHDRNVVHCDVKPENVLLSISPEGRIVPKLADFGLSTVLDETTPSRGFVGSLAYAAPEVLSGKTYTRASDVWSIGVMLYAMLSGLMAFPGDDISPQVALESIMRGPPCMQDPIWMSISEYAKDLVRWMLQVEPSMRPTMKEIMAHPWVANLGFGKKLLDMQPSWDCTLSSCKWPSIDSDVYSSLNSGSHSRELSFCELTPSVCNRASSR